MVDAIVSYAVQRLGDFLIQESKFLSGVKDEMVWLQNELTWMRSFLKDAEQKQDGDARIRVWVSDIQDIAYDAEDIIQTFIFKVNGKIQTSNWGSFKNFVNNWFGISRKADLYGIGKEIEALKNRVLDVSRKRESYGIVKIDGIQEGTSSGASILRDLRITTSYADEEHVVGFEDDAQFLGEKLFLKEPRRCVISILGMGGLGKTTLARKLYNKNNTRFNLHAWVCVSQEWKTRDLLERLIKSFKRTLIKDEFEMLEKMKDYDMEQYLREILEGHRYLVVIDDVWHKEAWESLRRALPDNKNRSRIIITTRKESVAELSNQCTYVHKLRFLRPDESLKLFYEKALPGNSGSCPPEVMKLGEEMMAKCGGLPLAIIVLGGLLSRKQFHEWHMVKERIWYELNDESIHISYLLALSYNDLPHELKSCFLYLGLFPEDFIINAEKLIRLWIAEEFIPQGEGRDLEELAQNYMNELIGRSLIQVVKRNWRTVSTCRIHDLLRDLAVNKAKELNFLHVSDETINSASSTVTSSYRRIAFHSRFKSYKFDHSHQRVRTLSFLNNEFLTSHSYNEVGVENLMKLLYPRFRLLRVLDLEGVRNIGEVQLRGVGNLIHLRYLGLNKTGIVELPECIENLQSLQTLDVSDNNRRIVLPRGVCKLKQLRHLIGLLKIENQSSTHHAAAATPLLLFEELSNLQTLKIIEMGSIPIQETGNRLALNAFAKLQNLQILALKFDTQHLVSIEPLLNCRKLIELKIEGKIGDLPKQMHKFLPNLKFLKLSWSRFNEDPIPALEMLPNLLVLILHKVGVKIMTFTAAGFPQLEVLTITRLLNGRQLAVEEGAMPRLRALTMDEESHKSLLPERLRSLPDRKVMNWEWEWEWEDDISGYSATPRWGRRGAR